jgi:5'/3'-nucleotidase SurE
MKVLLTNDDGIQATGLNTMRRALLEVPGVELAVIAPDSNRSATARSITTREPAASATPPTAPRLTACASRRSDWWSSSPS